MIIKSNKQNGEVALFVVILAALLISVIVVSFIRIMVADQKQASNTDLSQSAYDSAQVGVEDAKRALLRYQSCITSGSTDSDCTKAINSITSSTQKCNDVLDGLVGVNTANNGEVTVQTHTDASNSLDQAYTCLKISLKTDDVVGYLKQDANNLIPLVGESGFNTIKIDWFSPSDMGDPKQPGFKSLTGTPLLNQNSWSTGTGNVNRPSIMRAQLIMFNNSKFSLSDFSNDNAPLGNLSKTLFLYPSHQSALALFSSDGRGSAKSIIKTDCSMALNSDYACSATITLPKAVTTNTNTAFLNLSSIYRGTNYRITLLNSGEAVKFNDVQPEVDSTGRANDLFRRVESRVTLVNSNFPYPNAAVNITGDLCKDFLVTNEQADYSNNCTQD